MCLEKDTDKTMKNMKNTKLVALMLAVVMFFMNSIPMHAAEIETTETVEIETVSMSLEDMLAEEDNTDEVVEEETFATLNLNIPASVVMSRDGIALLSMETTVMLTDGVVTLSQPVADEYYNRLESDVTITVVDGVITVTFEGQNVVGSATDALGNTVSFDGQTLTIINSEKMEDVVEETEEPDSEEDEDVPVEPEEQPASYNVNYYINSVATENLLNTEEVQSVVGATIDLTAIELNKFKPANTETLTFVDGVMVDFCETVTADDSDIINIVYLSEVVVVYGDYTVNYYKNEVAEENLLATNNVTAELGSAIDVATIELNAHKPENTETTQWFDGVVVDSATVVTEDDSDVINIVYTSEEIIPEVPEVAEATYTVKYYADALQTINYLGEIQVAGNVSDAIDFDLINVNAFLPVGYGDGEIQTVVSATVVTEDDSDVVYVLYTRVNTVVEYVQEIITLPGETEYVYITETVIKEVEIIKEIEKIVEVIKEVEVPVYIEVEKIVEKIIEVPVEVIVTEIIEKIITEYEYIEVPYEVIVEIIKEVEKEVIVEVPGETVYVEVPGETVYVTEYVEVPVEKEVEKIVYVEVEKDNDDPTEPEEGTDPEAEYDSDEPINPEDNPQTGDETSILFFVIMAMISVFGMCYVSKKEKVAR